MQQFAIVKEIFDDTAVLEIQDTGQELAWPVSGIGKNIYVGDRFVIQLKPTQAQVINDMVVSAKNQHFTSEKQKTDAMQKMLETLIN